MPTKKNSVPRLRKKRKKTNSESWDAVFGVLRDQAASRPSPSLNVLTDAGSSPWQILVSTILSLRTRDEVTLATSSRLYTLAADPAATRSLAQEIIEQAIFPAGFYRTKARQILAIAHLLKPLKDQVPSDRDILLTWPGVGRKTANLVLNLAFGIEAICVDTHVHRIPNRLGWITTRTPEESEVALEALWPRKHWIEANGLLVSFGQEVCTPTSPRCSICPFRSHCLRKGVERSR